ncbi:unnamed protein product [Gongylonema pulchrum]|uniref:Late endosomal/lysosomal adaptor and MAPK and MTOR activator 1 n=1 Tax=Gongylonema pulchrum TaxID=637853 RepID=A0A183EDR3_9BILA|nr:unnamed protein product [Gongylonema pulchrum]
MAVAVQQHEPQEQQHRPEIDMGLKKKAESFDELNSSVTGATQEDETADEQQRQQQQQQQQQQECSQSYSMPSTSLHLDSAWQQRVREYVATSMQGVLNDEDFNQNLQRAVEAIKAGVQPIRISAGSSGIVGASSLIFSPKLVYKQSHVQPDERLAKYCCDHMRK